MQIIRNINEQNILPCVATIGFFDGIHRGHQFLLQQVKTLASNKHLCSAVITFPVHPRKVMQQDYQPQLLTSLEEKCTLLEKQGIDYTILLPFNQEMSKLSAREFMLILQEKLNVKMLVIGYDHRFGHNREEGFDDYVRYGKEMNMQVIQAQAWTQDEAFVSSSMVRKLIGEGNVSKAALCLGTRYTLQGTVVDGYKVGRKIGFPTANICPLCPEKLLPANGVYAVWVTLNNQRYKGMLNIGQRPTVDNGTDTSIEVHLLNFNEDIYHHTLTLEFVERLREEQRFDSTSQLIEQLKQDAQSVDNLLSSC
ncbi:MAG: bifunctional riboflavin kinase/FAD synthetase [Bacteroidales bacterium]|nr:bifunctional riboflavin kinase/FAD synthetase [Candidatus Minthousia equi]